MFERLKDFIAELSGDAEHDPAFADDDFRLATAALMIHAMEVDGIVREREKAKLKEIIHRRFEMGDTETRQLIDEAREKNHEAVDLYGFTSVLTRKFDQEGRQRIVRHLWEMVLADEEVHEFEDNFVWRVSELLGVSTRDRIRMKKEIEADIGHPGADDAEGSQT